MRSAEIEILSDRTRANVAERSIAGTDDESPFNRIVAETRATSTAALAWWLAIRTPAVTN